MAYMWVCREGDDGGTYWVGVFRERDGVSWVGEEMIRTQWGYRWLRYSDCWHADRTCGCILLILDPTNIISRFTHTVTFVDYGTYVIRRYVYIHTHPHTFPFPPQTQSIPRQQHT